MAPLSMASSLFSMSSREGHVQNGWKTLHQVKLRDNLPSSVGKNLPSPGERIPGPEWWKESRQVLGRPMPFSSSSRTSDASEKRGGGCVNFCCVSSLISFFFIFPDVRQKLVRSVFLLPFHGEPGNSPLCLPCKRWCRETSAPDPVRQLAPAMSMVV